MTRAWTQELLAVDATPIARADSRETEPLTFFGETTVTAFARGGSELQAIAASAKRMPLRDYQWRGLRCVGACIKRGILHLVYVAPTGSGKTVVMVYLILVALSRGKRVIVMAHRRELILQVYRKLIEYGLPEAWVGIIMANDSRSRPGAPVQIASIDTLRCRVRPPADVVFIDEAHRALAATYRKVLDDYVHAVVIGLTATPIRTDGKGLDELFDELVVGAKYSELIASGHLVEPRVFTARPSDVPDLSGVAVKGGDYDLGALSVAVNKGAIVGNIVEHYQRHGQGAPTFAFAVDVAHSKHIVERFCRAGIAAAHVDGETPTAERDAALEGLKTGKVRIVSNCDVFCEGTDVPCVKTIILARPTKSLRLYLQQCGRGARPFGDLRFTILDHAGLVPTFGLPQADRTWSLEGTPKDGHGVAPTKACEECGAVVPLGTRVCPECGWLFPEPPERSEVDGELEEVKILTEAEGIAAWAKVVDDWHAKNAQRAAPFKPGWCFYEYRRRHFGQEPPRCCRAPRLSAEEQERRRRHDEHRGDSSSFDDTAEAWR